MSPTPPITPAAVTAAARFVESDDGRPAGAAAARVLLLGTPTGITQLHQMLDQIDAAVTIVDTVPIKPPRAVEGGAAGGVSEGTATAGRGLMDDLEGILAASRVDRILVCLPAAMDGLRVEVERRAAARGIGVRAVPTFADLLQLDASQAEVAPPASRRGAMPSIDPLDPATAARLLDRTPHPLDESAICGTLAGRRVLITGAGGSIGSELARLVAGFAPAQLLLMDRAENALFEIDRVLAAAAPGIPRRMLLHDVADASRTRQLVHEHRPHVIFHAAAHKHVPMMEDHPAAAITNNVFGTAAIADAARTLAELERFVLVSTDKAVHPRSVMGATKRAAELYIQHLATAGEQGFGGGRRRDSAASAFSIVRFGNVLGSACSVIPIWQHQLANGEALTVTHREMTRYFMTIREAASLVLQAAAFEREFASPCRIYTLDMGEPIRILDLAERFIRLHGLTPHADVPIAFSGVRPGEKLHEQLAAECERLQPTIHPAIHRLEGVGPGIDAPALLKRLHALRHPGHDHATTRQQLTTLITPPVAATHPAG